MKLSLLASLAATALLGVRGLPANMEDGNFWAADEENLLLENANKKPECGRVFFNEDCGMDPIDTHIDEVRDGGVELRYGSDKVLNLDVTVSIGKGVLITQ